MMFSVGLPGAAAGIGWAGLMAVSGTLPPPVQPPNDGFRAAVLAVHNRERARMKVAPLRWSAVLAAGAQTEARRLARMGRLAHLGGDDRIGENLWQGTRGAYPPGAMVALWIAEGRNYKPGIFPANSRTGRLDDVAHYTQVIWSSTNEVGCARASNRQDDFLVCRYGEGGNVIGERPVPRTTALAGR